MRRRKRPFALDSADNSAPFAGRELGRRSVLRCAGCALAGGLLSPRRALANVKMAKADAEYRDTPRGGMRCENCVQFLPPSACKIVMGEISPSGSCDLFTPKPH